MSAIKGKIGDWELEWLGAPGGDVGVATVDVKGKDKIEVRWKRDGAGLWLELPHGTFGFDFSGEPDESDRLSYRVNARGAAEEWEGLSYVRAGQEAALAASGSRRSGLRVRAQMPGKIVRVMAKTGDRVEKDQPLLVMEAMKMENEIRALQAGKVVSIKVTDGQAVESGADLMMIEAE